MAETPLFMDQVCYGLDLRNYDINLLLKRKKINLAWIMELYKASPQKEKFFDSKLSREMNTIEIQIGTSEFRQQIIAGVPEEEIRKSWEPGLSNYKKNAEKIFDLRRLELLSFSIGMQLLPLALRSTQTAKPCMLC